MRPRIFVPGWGGSGPDHWQTRWQAQLRGARRVEMPDWFSPERGPWIAAIERTVAATTRDVGQPPVLIAHSLGCIAVAAWAEVCPRLVAGALLVAPPDLDAPGTTAELRSFGPIPQRRLPFPSKLIVSDNDPYISAARAARLAAAWGSDLDVVPGAGHLNVASGHGDWPEGLLMLRQLVASAA
ncbi:MAG: alpha/beta hydrolase [Kofleriaceae bacterium]